MLSSGAWRTGVGFGTVLGERYGVSDPSDPRPLRNAQLPPFHLCSHGSGRSWRLGRSVARVVRSPPPMDPPPSGKRPRSRRRGRRTAPGRSGGNPCQRLLRSSAREPAGLYLALCSVGDWRGMDEASPCFLWNRPWMETRARDRRGRTP